MKTSELKDDGEDCSSSAPNRIAVVVVMSRRRPHPVSYVSTTSKHIQPMSGAMGTTVVVLENRVQIGESEAMVVIDNLQRPS